MEGQENEKISLPTGLCVYEEKNVGCKDKSFCFCCLVTNLCYVAIDICKSECVKHSSLGIEASKKHRESPSNVMY